MSQLQIKGYTQISSEMVSELDNSQVIILEHDKTKAKIMYIANDDEHKTFGIGFRTPITDSTGVPHIMEHSVLCGSRKFDIKDPFVELAKGSLNTYLNAMTYPDKTLYPVSSENNQDFHNLMDVYLDAVFFPNIYKTPYLLMQEGWRYDLENADAPLLYKGVVYNEMKGAFSSPEEVMFRKIKESLFPNTTYQHESGGAPENIVDLTFEQYTDYHKKFYHPSNSYICIYGEVDIAETLEFIDKDYLSHFEYQQVDSKIDHQAPVNVVESYAYSVTEEKDDQLYLSYNVVVGEASDKKFTMAMGILEYILLDTPASPLKKALLKENIGEDVFGVFQTHLKQPIFSIVAKNVSKDKEERFYQLIDEVLENLITNKIDKALILPALQVKEFALREGDSRGYSKGLGCFISSLKGWLYDADPIEQLKYDKAITEIKEVATNGYFEDLIKTQLLDNMHMSKIKLYPVVGLDKQMEDETTAKLASIKSKLSADQINELIEQTKAFKEFQETPDKIENVHSIPLLTKDELETEPMYPTFDVITKNDTNFIVTELFTNKIAYLSWYFHLEGIEKKYLPYVGALVGILGKMDTKNYTYDELSIEIDSYLGGMEFHVQGLSNYKQEGLNERYFIVKTKSLTKYLDKQLHFFAEIMQNTKFNDGDRLLEILKELRAMMQVAISGEGHKIAVSRLLSHFTPLQEFEELTKGLSFYHMIENVIDNWSTAKTEFINNLAHAYSLLNNRARIQIGITADETQPIVDEMDKQLQSKFEFTPFNDEPVKFEDSQVKEGIRYAGNVNYVALGYNFKDLGYQYSGSMQILKSIISMDYLWTQVRVKNGAYGCFADFKKSGNVFFASYRDPNVKETLDIYHKLGDYVANLEVDDRELLQYLIGTISSLDFPFTPYTEGACGQLYYLTSVTKADLQKSRDEMFATTKETLQSFGKLIKDVTDKNQYCVFGNTTSIEENKDIFSTIINV
ncbi:MAG: peptidase M16 [Epulopiscium sp. Nele67-Bin004]|nr:MAG: peptidase M16 [Epulopiscium sp. Nele67-Bin004]